MVNGSHKKSTSEQDLQKLFNLQIDKEPYTKMIVLVVNIQIKINIYNIEGFSRVNSKIRSKKLNILVNIYWMIFKHALQKCKNPKI